MVAQNTAETDEQIIDLTELIEKGEVPANDPSVQSRAHAAAEAEAEKEELQEHLRDLNDGAAGADAEIDDLLAQMDIKAEGQEDPTDVALDFSAPSTQTDHHIDPNEQLNMPGMGEVDSLLNSLDIPPQPSDREAEVASPETTDKAVDALLNDFNAPAAPIAAPVAANHDAPDLDELLASAGTMPRSDTSSQIDDLLNEASPIQTAAPAPQPVAAPQPAPSASMDIDIDSLLAAAANDMQQGLDAAEHAATPAAEPAAAPAQAAPADMGIDIDSLLAAAANDMQQGLDAAEHAASPAAVPAAAAAVQPAPASPAAAISNDDLDSLLAAATADLDADPSPAPAPQAAPQPAPAAPADMGVDIDSLLAAAASDLQQTLDAAPSAAPATPQAAVEAEAEVAAEAGAAPQPDLGIDLDSLLAAVDASATPAAAEPQAAPEMADPFAAALEAVAEAAQPEPEVLPEIEAAQLLAPQPEAALETEPETEFAAGAQPELMDILPEDQAAAPDTDADTAPDTAAATDADVVAETAADIEAMMAAAAGQALSAEDSAEQDIPADSADDLLAAMSADLSAQPVADILPESFTEAEPAHDDLPPMEPVTEQMTEPVAELVPELVPELVADPIGQPDSGFVEIPVDDSAPESDPQIMLPDFPEFETSTAALAAQLQDDTDPTGLESQAALNATLAAVSAEALEAVMTQANEASSHALDAFAQAFDASTRAADAADAVGNLAARVEQCERALQEAGERIIALETALESQIAASHNLAATALPRQELEGMFMEGHPLHQGLMECISKAVGEALAAAPAAASAPAQPTAAADVQALIDEHLQPIIAAARIATARVDALESRLDALEPRFNDRVEKAAAAAAARILREEIGRLLEE